ncbi:MAG: hypothetical protein Q8858_08595 [Bacteroidota bacterium]|nr:hypothetical protein [Bacteroidota bacterium]
MRTLSRVIGLLIVTAFIFATISTAQEGSKSSSGTKSAKEIFTTNKCNSFHEMKAEKISKTGKSKAPDLSMVGTDKNAEWVEKFLTKKETLDNKKHPISFKGTDSELKTLATWIASHGKKESK